MSFVINVFKNTWDYFLVLIVQSVKCKLSHYFCLHLTCVHIALLGLKDGYEHLENYLTPSAPVEAAAAGIGTAVQEEPWTAAAAAAFGAGIDV